MEVRAPRLLLRDRLTQRHKYSQRQHLRLQMQELYLMPIVHWMLQRRQPR